MRRICFALCTLALSLALVAPVFADTSYTVQPGDTLTKIAARFNVTVEAIVQANRLANPNAIRVGQTLTIPEGQPAPPPPPTGSPSSGAPPAPAPFASGNTYIVQKGDSVSRIASRFNITVEELMQANNLTTTTLQIGQVLVIPGAAARPQADSVYGRIYGDAAFVRRVRAALDWLQARDADAYQRVNTYVSVIRPSPYRNLAQAIPMQEGGCLVRALARPGQSVEMIAALLYHEATHCYQFATEGLKTTKEAEVYAYSEQIAFMERHGYPADVIDYYRRILEYYQSQPDDGSYIPPPRF